MIVYSNFSSILTNKQLNSKRKLSKYKKKGYGGHPSKYLFSFPLDYKINIMPIIKNISIDLIVFIHCRTDEFYERYLSRKMYNNTSKVIFIYITSRSKIIEVNKKLLYESKLYNDILQFNEISSYFNLSIQTTHMILWSINFNYKFLLKTDIDVYININLILSILENYKQNSNYFALVRVSNTFIIRNKKYSHYVPYHIIKENVYPPYLQGVGYIIPYKTALLISKRIEDINPKIWIEDVYMGYVFQYNNITLINLSEYILRDLPYNISGIVNYADKYMFIHGFYPIEILKLKHLCF